MRLSVGVQKGDAAAGALGPEYYDSVYSDSKKYRGWYGHSLQLPLWKWISGRLRSLKNPSILEIGCGTGQGAHHFWNVGLRNYHGVDFSPVAIESARRRVPGVRFTLGDVTKKELYEEKYDAVVAVEVLEHLDDDLAILRMVRNGTRFFFSVPNLDSPGHVRYFLTEDDVKERYEPYLINRQSGRISYWFLGAGTVVAKDQKDNHHGGNNRTAS